MSFYPVYLDLNGKTCLVIGTSGLAEEKARQLLQSGACLRRSASFTVDAAQDVFLIIADVEEEEAGHLALFCNEQRIFLNVVDKPAHCSFILPAVVRREDLLIAVSTSGKSPSLAGKIRQELEHAYGREFARFTRILGTTREKVKALMPAYSDRKSFYSDLLDEQLAVLRKTGTADGLEDAILKRLEEVKLATDESKAG